MRGLFPLLLDMSVHTPRTGFFFSRTSTRTSSRRSCIIDHGFLQQQQQCTYREGERSKQQRRR